MARYILVLSLFFKKKYEKILILRELIDEIAFSSLIAFNGKLTSQCDNLSILHIIITLHSILVSTRNFVTARLRNNISALLPCLSGKVKAIEPPFCTKEIGKEKTRMIALTKIGLARKGDPRKGCERHSTTTKSRSGSCAWRFCGDNFVASSPALRVRRRVLFFVVFVPVNDLQVCPLVCLLRHC